MKDNMKIISASYTSLDEGNLIRIKYLGLEFRGTMEIFPRFFPCPPAKLKTFLKMFKEPLDQEYRPMCWYLLQECLEKRRSIGAAGKRMADMLLKDIIILQDEIHAEVDG